MHMANIPRKSNSTLEDDILTDRHDLCFVLIFIKNKMKKFYKKKNIKTVYINL